MSADKTPLAGTTPFTASARAVTPEPPAPDDVTPGSQLDGRPTRRPLVRYSLRLAGHKVFIEVNFWPGTRRVYGFFIDLHKEGAPLRSSAAIVAESNNRALQQGASLASVCEALRTAFFEPKGTVENHPTIREAESLFDLVAQVLEDEDAELHVNTARAKQEARANSEGAATAA